ncbi:MAG: SPOR domain-containing protein [Zetaproteobacteria bacterium]|nr:SPOR domain-containing protein [Zetaproteobacteria bacterium]
MSDIDFANYDNQPPEWMQQEPEKRSSPMMLAVFFVLGAGAGFGAHYAINLNTTSFAEQKAQRELSFAQKNLEKEQVLTARLQAKIDALEEEKNAAPAVDQLTFYNNLPAKPVMPEPLPQSPVTSTEIAEATATQPLVSKPLSANSGVPLTEAEAMTPVTRSTSTSKKTQQVAEKKVSSVYRLQVASYTDYAQALSFQPKLQALGFTSDIVAAEIPKLGTRYRVYAVGFQNSDEASKAKATIKKKLKIEPIIVKGD